jgi:hypothetical protein
MKNQIRFLTAWVYQIILGLMLGFLVGFLVAIKPNHGSGILKNSDTLPFVLGMGLLFVMIVTRFCSRMDSAREEPPSRSNPASKETPAPLDFSKLFSLIAGIAGIGLMVMSFLRTFKILAR